MTSRERVLAALDHEEPDRVPIDLGGTFVTGIAATALYQLRKHLGLEDRPVKINCLLQMLAEVEMDLVERLDLDVLPVELPTMTFGLRREGWKPCTLFDGTPTLMPGDFNVDVTEDGDWLLRPLSRADKPPTGRMPKDGFYFDQIGYGRCDPNYQPPPIEQLKKSSRSWIYADATLQWLADQARQLRRNTDKALVLGVWGAAGVHYVGTFPEFLCLLAADKPYVRDLFALSSERAIENLRLLWQAVGEDVDLITISGLDFGTQRGGFFSRETFQDLYLPAFAEQFAWIHEHTTWKIFEHSCGSVAHVIEDLVDAGLDALNPVQTSAAGMNPRWLKDTFGDRVTFWGGGVETQSTLPFGAPDEVRQQVRERIEVFAPGGGFVFNPVHNIQPCTPPQNIAAAYETALEFGRYPIRTGNG